MTGPVEEVALSILSALERATEIGPLLLLAGFMLMLDCVSLKSYHVNILHLTQSPELVGPQLAIEAFLVVISIRPLTHSRRANRRYGALAMLPMPSRSLSPNARPPSPAPQPASSPSRARKTPNS
jgi:hypothetical protein